MKYLSYSDEFSQVFESLLDYEFLAPHIYPSSDLHLAAVEPVENAKFGSVERRALVAVARLLQITPVIFV